MRHQGERYFADGLRDISSDRRLAILAVCAVEWRAAIADAVVETHDRIVGKTWRDAKKTCDARIADAKLALHDTLRSFKSLGAALLEAKGDGASRDIATETACGWHVESDAISRALAMVIQAQSDLPMAQCWGGGVTASSDGQFFPAARQGEAMNLINAKYGSEPGLKAYPHVSDQFGPFATQNIPATVNEAPYILDGLLMNDTGRKIKEQYADTGGFTDLVFAATSLLSYRFIPRIRDLPSTRLYLFDPAAAPKELRGLIGGKIRESLIVQNGPAILRAVATMAAGIMLPSQLLKKFASYPRQHELALALSEIGRIERTLFVIDWVLDADMQRRAQIGLNKGEAHHALKNALRIGRQGEIRDRTTEGQHYRMAGLNLLAAIIIYWNTKHLGQAVTARKRAGLDCSPELLSPISALGWAHILLTGEYRWQNRR